MHIMKKDLKSHLIIIPAYNEESNIESVIKNSKEANPIADILVVNDGSDDNTLIIAKRSGAMVLDLTSNLGYGSAIQAGFQFATEYGYDYAVTLDGDGQHDPHSVNNLIKLLSKENADVVIGSRFLKGIYKMEITRKLGSWLFSLIAHLYTKTRFTDPTSGFQLFNRKAFSYLSESENYPMDYPDVNTIMALHNAGFKIVEAPVTMFRKSEGKSMHSGLKPIFYILRMLIAIIIQLFRKE